jgi:hypothetical protein
MRGDKDGQKRQSEVAIGNDGIAFVQHKTKNTATDWKGTRQVCGGRMMSLLSTKPDDIDYLPCYHIRLQTLGKGNKVFRLNGSQARNRGQSKLEGPRGNTTP